MEYEKMTELEIKEKEVGSRRRRKMRGRRRGRSHRRKEN